MLRAQSRLSGESKFSQQNRFRWLDEIYDELITEQKLYTDYRINVNDWKGEQLFSLGGIWHNLAGQYIGPEEAQTLDLGDPITWTLNKPQKRAWSLFPAILDRNRENPIVQVQLRGGRRGGKTECGIMLGLAFCVVSPFSKGAVFSIDYKSTQEMLEKIKALARPEWLVSFDNSLQTLYFKNGSSIVFFSQRGWKKAGRSYSFDFVILDEAPFYDNTRAVLTGCKGAIVEHDGAIISIYSPAPAYETMYWEEQKSKSPDKEISDSNKTIYFGSSFDNVFLSEKAKRKIRLQAKSMSEGEYTREILGKYAKADGLCVYSYHPDTHLIDTIPPYLFDITTDYICKRWDFPDKEQMEWICGLDFNSAQGTGTTLTLQKMYWDPMGGTMIVHNAIQGLDGNTEKFIYNNLLPMLKSYYPTLTDREVAKKCLLIIDSSGFWQSARQNNTTSKDVIPDQLYLKNAGFKSIPPQNYKRGMNKNRHNQDNIGPNPSRIMRRESFLSRVLDRYGQPHYYFLRQSCGPLAVMMENLTIVNGLPDSKSDYIHYWDALSYPTVCLYPKIQLFSTDPDNLSKTYRYVYEIGQEKMTREQRMMHPVCIATGKDFIT